MTQNEGLFLVSMFSILFMVGACWAQDSNKKRLVIVFIVLAVICLLPLFTTAYFAAVMG